MLYSAGHCFFFNDTATTEIYTLSLHDALPILDEAKFPSGVFNLVNGDGAITGDSLTSHPDIDMISFTGSTRAGALISQNAAKDFKRISLELGGKGANIIFKDADSEAIARGVLRCFRNSGQSCNAPTRMLVEKSIYNETVEKVKKLGHLYYDIRSGLSAAKTPQEYGAFPFDPYSHTPAHSGAQQPGMTGQVKEEILTRFGELGCLLVQGSVKFEPCLLKQNEFLTRKRVFEYYDVFQQKKLLTIQKGQLAYTFCQVPVIYTLSDTKCKIILDNNDSSRIELEGNRLDEIQSSHIFDRDNRIKQVNLFIHSKSLFD